MEKFESQREYTAVGPSASFRVINNECS